MLSPSPKMAAPMAVRVALVEDNPTFRRRFLERFRFFEDVEVVLAAGSGEEFLDRLDALPEERQPQAVLMDIEMPGISGIETTARLRERRPELDVLMLTVFEDEDKIFSAIQAGASGYLLKDASAGAIVGAVLELQRGGAPMSPSVARKMLAYVRAHEQPAGAAPAGTFTLSERELEILNHLVRDETEAAIAEALYLSPHTVRSHVKNIYKKLHVHSRASAVRVALQSGLVRR